MKVSEPRREPIPWRRVSGFILVPMAGAIAPIRVLPSLTSTLGSAGWASIAIGQSLGIFAMTLTAAGWGTVGPPRYAATDAHELADLYRTSLMSRALLWLPSSSLAGVIAWWLADPSFRMAAALMVPGMAVWSLGGVWYFTAAGTPSRIFLFDTLPKLMASVATVVLLQHFPYGSIYPLVLLAFGAFTVSVVAFICARTGSGAHFRDAWIYLTEHAALNASRLATAGITTLTVPLVAVVSPSSVAGFAAVDRLRVLAATALAAVTSSFQGWLYRSGLLVEARRRTADLALVLAGILGGLSLLILGKFAESLLFSDVAALSFGNLAFQGAAVSTISVSAAMTYFHLGPENNLRPIIRASVLGVIVGVPAILVFAHEWGATGGALGVLLGEVAVGIMLLGSVYRPRRRR